MTVGSPGHHLGFFLLNSSQFLFRKLSQPKMKSPLSEALTGQQETNPPFDVPWFYCIVEKVGARTKARLPNRTLTVKDILQNFNGQGHTS